MSILPRVLQPSLLTALPDRLYETTQPDGLSQPAFVHINNKLLAQLGLDSPEFAGEETLALLAAKRPIVQPQPIATVYAGHQFGIYTSRLGDGRVHILGDISANNGTRWELQLKGAGPTAFARGNSGRMDLAEAIAEYLGSEAMAGLGIPCSRGLAIIGQARGPETIFVRTAHSHLRFGHFEYCHNQGDPSLLKALADHVIEHYYPELMAVDGHARYLQFLYAVTRRTARLLAQWQAAGFVHSVMNTDNMSILGLTIDFGRYGFMPAYDPAYCANDDDEQERYAFDQQVEVGRWNCLALAEALTGLLPGQRIPANLLRLYRQSYTQAYLARMCAKLGLSEPRPDDEQLINGLLALLRQNHLDYTRSFRRLSRIESAGTEAMSIGNPDGQTALQAWLSRYRERLAQEESTPEQREAMRLANNPKFILRQALLDEVIRHASRGHFTPLDALLTVLQSPYAEHEEFEHLS